mmetsp:Transcript_125/g.408  ORF Transcript_125/g.408 Transcript_125/m.408 type:complete len:83 (+) Transcript_125:1132-1380(+)
MVEQQRTQLRLFVKNLLTVQCQAQITKRTTHQQWSSSSAMLAQTLRDFQQNSSCLAGTLSGFADCFSCSHRVVYESRPSVCA